MNHVVFVSFVGRFQFSHRKSTALLKAMQRQGRGQAGSTFGVSFFSQGVPNFSHLSPGISKDIFTLVKVNKTLVPKLGFSHQKLVFSGYSSASFIWKITGIYPYHCFSNIRSLVGVLSHFIGIDLNLFKFLFVESSFRYKKVTKKADDRSLLVLHHHHRRRRLLRSSDGRSARPAVKVGQFCDVFFFEKIPR